MRDWPKSVLQVNTFDVGGGAEAVARQLFEAYRARGLVSRLAVGCRRSDDPDVQQIPKYDEPGALERWLVGAEGSRNKGRPGPLLRLIRGVERRFLDLSRCVARNQGREIDGFGGARELLKLPNHRPDILHCHNLHGSYFDLYALPRLSRQIPTHLTLHDAWAVSGHCAHSLGCDRWQTGCGSCPDLAIYPPIKRDATSYNWRQKQALFHDCRLHLVTPSNWLMDLARQSMLWPGVVACRVIANGVDQKVFRPENKALARAELKLPANGPVVVFAANGVKSNRFKDYETMRQAAEQICRRDLRENWLLLALGEDAPPDQLGKMTIRFIPTVRDPLRMARYYQAADLYWHAARADTFPTTILEALSCGTPVVATAVGGVPEQVKALRRAAHGNLQCSVGLRLYSGEEATGALVGLGDAVDMADATCEILANSALLRRLSENAARDAQTRFSLERQVTEYLEWYAQSKQFTANAA